MPTTKRPPSAKVALKLTSLTFSERISLANAISTAMTGNPKFPNPPVTPKMLAAAATTLDKAETSARAARQAAAMRLSERDDASQELDSYLMQLAHYVDSQANGAKNVIDSASMPVKGTPVRSTTPPDAPDPLAAFTGAKSGQAKLKWAGSKGAKSYVVERTVNPNDPASWTHVAATTKRGYTADGVPQGRTWFRVAAIGSQGQGHWSDPATCVVT